MASTWTILALGFGLGLSLAAPPGPILALSAQRTVHRGFWPGLAVPLGASTGDMTLAALMGFGVIRLLEGLPWLHVLLTLVGAAMLFLFAWFAWRSARRPPDLEHTDARAPAWSRRLGLVPGGFLAGYALAISSPFNFGWWLGAGTSLFGDYGWLVFAGFFAALVSFSIAFVALVKWASDRLEGVVTWVSYVSAIGLAAFGVLLLVNGVTALV